MCNFDGVILVINKKNKKKNDAEKDSLYGMVCSGECVAANINDGTKEVLYL